MFVEPAVLTATAAGEAPAGVERCVSLQQLETRVPAKATLLIGPEGGWATQEVSDAVAGGVTLATLGQRILRADAAGALAIAVLQYVWKDY
jgi:16S rRNA (uracil1498-N3)-methyltransferase